MKKTLKLILVAAGFVIAGSVAAAQNENSQRKNADWLSDKGYWVIQTNKNSPQEHTVYFYNTDNKLISKQQFKKANLKPGSRKTKVKLKKALEAALNTPGYSMGEADQPVYFAAFN